MSRVLFIPDLHCPWDHRDAVHFLSDVYEKFKCDRVICAGDEIDAAAFSTKWPQSPDLPSASEELEQAVRALRRYEEILSYPKGWKLIENGLEVDGVWYCHGEGISPGSWHLSHQKFKQSTVFGHLHSRGGIVYSQTRKKRHFALNAGCLIDIHAPAFSYGKHLTEKPTLGCGVVIDGDEGYFIPMKT